MNKKPQKTARSYTLDTFTLFGAAAIVILGVVVLIILCGDLALTFTKWLCEPAIDLMNEIMDDWDARL